MDAVVVAVSKDGEHRFSKERADVVRLVEGLGIEGDAHAGVTVQHRSRVAVDPGQPNLRQVHLLHDELFDELAAEGFEVAPGALGENITTHGIDLLALPAGTTLRLGPRAVVRITGLRNPCQQINRFRPGLLKQVVSGDGEGGPVRKAGVMGVVLQSGPVRPGDLIEVTLPARPHARLDRV